MTTKQPKKDNRGNYILIGRGDNIYTRQFRTMDGVYAFLYRILADIDAAFDDLAEFTFDCEDDQIELITPEGEHYFANGWHWSYEQDQKHLLMPDGQTFYEKAAKLYDL